MQCLYCDTELKPFRGLFDEDFCSREHRERYFSSFRKALTDFGLPQEPAEDFVSQTTAPELPAPPAPSADPRTAGFQPITVLPLITEAARHGHQPELLAVCQRVEVPNHEITWSAVPDSDERPADLAEPSKGTFALFEPVPAALHVSAARFLGELGSESIAPSLESAGPAVSGVDDSVPGCHTPGMFDDPISLAPAQLSMPSLVVSAGMAALAPTPADEYAEITLFCQGLRSSPVLNSEIVLAHETHIPGFTPAREVLQGTDQGEAAPDPAKPYWGELYSEPEPAGAEFGSSLAVAPEMAWSSAPVDRPLLAQGNLPAMMPPSLELTPARSANVPALSPAVEPQPHLAPELATNFVDSDAGDSSAVPRSHAPLRLSFGNLVKIKNWRLRITFAKPA